MSALENPNVENEVALEKTCEQCQRLGRDFREKFDHCRRLVSGVQHSNEVLNSENHKLGVEIQVLKDLLQRKDDMIEDLEETKALLLVELSEKKVALEKLEEKYEALGYENAKLNVQLYKTEQRVPALCDYDVDDDVE
jgi:chromosome segregation ATPase